MDENNELSEIKSLQKSIYLRICILIFLMFCLAIWNLILSNTSINYDKLRTIVSSEIAKVKNIKENTIVDNQKQLNQQDLNSIKSLIEDIKNTIPSNTTHNIDHDNAINSIVNEIEKKFYKVVSQEKIANTDSIYEKITALNLKIEQLEKALAYNNTDMVEAEKAFEKGKDYKNQNELSKAKQYIVKSIYMNPSKYEVYNELYEIAINEIDDSNNLEESLRIVGWLRTLIDLGLKSLPTDDIEKLFTLSAKIDENENLILKKQQEILNQDNKKYQEELNKKLDEANDKFKTLANKNYDDIICYADKRSIIKNDLQNLQSIKEFLQEELEEKKIDVVYKKLNTALLISVAFNELDRVIDIMQKNKISSDLGIKNFEVGIINCENIINQIINLKQENPNFDTTSINNEIIKYLNKITSIKNDFVKESEKNIFDDICRLEKECESIAISKNCKLYKKYEKTNECIASINESIQRLKDMNNIKDSLEKIRRLVKKKNEYYIELVKKYNEKVINICETAYDRFERIPFTIFSDESDHNIKHIINNYGSYENMLKIDSGLLNPETHRLYEDVLHKLLEKLSDKAKIECEKDLAKIKKLTWEDL